MNEVSRSAPTLRDAAFFRKIKAMSIQTPTAEKRIGHESITLDARDVRALTEVMTVLGNQGRVRGADGLYEVVSASGSTYLVDTDQDACECLDSQYRDPKDGCKHLRRVAFEIGECEIPGWVDRDALDDGLGGFVDGFPQFEGESMGESEDTTIDDDERGAPTIATVGAREVHK